MEVSRGQGVVSPLCHVSVKALSPLEIYSTICELENNFSYSSEITDLIEVTTRALVRPNQNPAQSFHFFPLGL